jgi:hypothetical protein
MSPEERFTALRAKFVSDLEVSRAELATARETLAAAEAAHGEARTAWQELNAFLANAHRSPTEGTAAPLRHEILNSDEFLRVHSAESARGTARGAVKGLEYTVNELALAIDQVDLALTAAKITHLSPRVTIAPSRRLPQPVEFDDIEMSRRVV